MAAEELSVARIRARGREILDKEREIRGAGRESDREREKEREITSISSLFILYYILFIYIKNIYFNNYNFKSFKKIQ